jgi:isopentenyl diphosphate isomerase/L-lactate dehydrogenase-like FMN-dependent dehydrogenase
MNPINVLDYEVLARECMEPAIWDYYQGGSEDEVTLRANRTAFENIRFRPRMLRNVNPIDIRTTILEIPVTMPILIAPTALHCLAHAEGECATAQAASDAGTLMVASTFATRSLEEIANASNASLWLQLYIYRGSQVTETLIQRAEHAGYQAIVLTVDAPQLGRRERDIRNAFTLPSSIRIANFDRRDENETYLPAPAMVIWETVDWLRSITSLPIVLKGILTAEDALLAVAHNIDGIIVSNHGGRQLDGAIASIEALPEIAQAVSGQCEIYLDGGIRRGTDVLKALALGARAVLVGRPILWGLAVNGQEGVQHVLELLRAELTLAMTLSGCQTIMSIDNSLVKRI